MGDPHPAGSIPVHLRQCLRGARLLGEQPGWIPSGPATLTALQSDLGCVYTYRYEETNPADHCGRSCGVRSEKSSLGLNLSPLPTELDYALPVREQSGQF